MKYANTGDLEELQHGLEKIHHEPKSQQSQKTTGSDRYDKASGEREQEAHYSSTYQGCRVCGQNVIHLDGK